MTIELTFCGAAGEVTGSLYVIRTSKHTLLLECGLIQGGREAETRNREPFPVPIDDVDAVVLSHAHIDHSGRVPLLARLGYDGPVYVQNATRALCEIMLPDSGYLHEKDAEWENKKRRRKGQPAIEPLYTLEDAQACLSLFQGSRYQEPREILPGVTVTFHDAGHILGSSIVQVHVADCGNEKSLVFSGDLGYRDAPVMDPPNRIRHADTVLMESTYGDRLHRPFADTMEELGAVFDVARANKGNIIIPAFTVGRTQDLLYLMAENFDAWRLDAWDIFLDSPMGIEATEAYSDYRHLYGARLFGPDSNLHNLPNVYMTRSSKESMVINQIDAGAIIIAGSGMCTGGRVLHHLKNNIANPASHVVIVGYQAIGTLGRRIVDGAEEIRLWGKDYRVNATVHTIGGLSAHGDQQDLVDWYKGFANRPPLFLVHGEPHAQQALASRITRDLAAPVTIAEPAQNIKI